MASKQADADYWIPSLDGLRAISILLVLTAHVYVPGWKDLGGGLGVVVFFVLSGFLITRMLMREEGETGTVDLRPFYIRRLFRLFPLYYFVLGVYCVLILGFGLRPDGRPGFVSSLPWYLTYMQEIPVLSAGGAALPFYQSWSLGIEEKFYLIWPPLGFILFKRSRAACLVIAIVSISVLAPLTSIGKFVVPYVPICIGCLVAVLLGSPWSRRYADKLANNWSGWIALGMLVLAHFIIMRRSGLLSDFARTIYPVFVALMLVASLRASFLRRLLSTYLLRKIGTLSYGIYLIHLLARNLIEMAIHRWKIPQPSGISVYMSMLILATAGAWLLNVAIEAPLREAGRRMARKISARRETHTPDHSVERSHGEASNSPV